MKYSAYNIFSSIRESENYFILNLLSGSADILSPAEAEMIDKLSRGHSLNDPDFEKQLFSKGYISDAEQERILFKEKYLAFLDEREKEEVQVFFVPNYSCNFGCSYCYQDRYNNPSVSLSREVTDSFFEYISKEFAGRRKYLTLFGGEPLLNTPNQREAISYFIGKTINADIELCVVTNGYYLEEYLDLLRRVRIREIQVTLDGNREIHDKRRSLKGGGATFDKIVRGIDKSLEYGLSVNLRMVIDKSNINNLAGLASFAKNQGWTSNPLFKTQIGRNYELHHCQSSPEQLFDRLSLYAKIFELAKMNPVIYEFHKPAYSVSRFLSENGELPDPLFDSCPACKTEWAFDYTGRIYSCTATVGNEADALGTFYPEQKLNTELTERWQERDITAIEKCRSCNLSLACGGGCASVALNKSGNILEPDCRPVKELCSLGFSAYLCENEQ
jgi:uncharacterized protein